MASRLRATEAAVLTKNRVNEIEVRAIQERAEKREKFIQLKRCLRLWNRQIDQFIESALEGNYHIILRSTLVGGERLLKNNFSIFYINTSKFYEYKKALEIKQLEFNRSRNHKIRQLKSILLREIEAVVEAFKNDLRFAGMTVTKDNAARQLIEKIEDYKSNITFHRESEPDGLFKFIFDGQLYLFKPMDSLKSNFLVIQKKLHKIAYLSYNPAANDKSELENNKDYSDQIFSDVLGNQLIIPNKFKTKLIAGECRESVDIKNSGDFFQIKWKIDRLYESWDFDDLASAAPLNWLASGYGQKFIEKIEAAIKQSIHQGLSEACICLYDKKINSWVYDFGDSGEISGPNPRLLSRLLRIMKYRVIFEIKQKSNNFEVIKATISW